MQEWAAEYEMNKKRLPRTGSRDLEIWRYFKTSQLETGENIDPYESLGHHKFLRDGRPTFIPRLSLKLAHIPEEKAKLGVDAEAIEEKIVGVALRPEEKMCDRTSKGDEALERLPHRAVAKFTFEGRQLHEQLLLALLVRLLDPGLVHEEFDVLLEHAEQPIDPCQAISGRPGDVLLELGRIAENVSEGDRRVDALLRSTRSLEMRKSIEGDSL